MIAAALLSYGLSLLLHFPDGQWAALSAVIVSRPQPGAAAQAALDRFVGTLAGAVVACVMSLGRIWGLPDVAILAATLVPLAALVAWREGYRTAPIAGLIVLAASPAGHGPLDAAVLRVVEIGLGVIVGTAMTWLILPARPEREARALGREALARYLDALAAAQAGDDARCDRLQAAARQCARALARLGPSVPWGDATPLTALQAELARLGTSLGFAIRAMKAARAAGNPTIESDAITGGMQRLRAAASPSVPAEMSVSEPDVPAAERQRNQAKALGVALAMARRDVEALMPSLNRD
jgi:uncharacterized membrane protein YccC